jgi:hypothetical protein
MGWISELVGISQTMLTSLSFGNAIGYKNMSETMSRFNMMELHMGNREYEKGVRKPRQRKDIKRRRSRPGSYFLREISLF